jgi:hypothetical protein
MAVQQIKFTKAFQEGNIWIVPEHIIYSETGEKKEPGKKEPTKYTVVHVTGKDGKVFIKEHPDEINRILRGMKKTQKKTITIEES